MEMLVKKGNTTRLNNNFELCQPLNKSNKLDVWSFFASFANFFSRIVTGSPTLMDRFCDAINSPNNKDAIDALTAFFSMLRGDAQDCWDYTYENQLNSVISTSWDSSCKTMNIKTNKKKVIK